MPNLDSVFKKSATTDGEVRVDISYDITRHVFYPVVHKSSKGYLKNLALVASSFGIGLGMIMGNSPKAMKRFFPLFAVLLFLLIAFAPLLRLTHLPVPGNQYEMFGHPATMSGGWRPLWFLLGTFVFFVVLGGMVGERLALLEPLRGYGWRQSARRCDWRGLGECRNDWRNANSGRPRRCPLRLVRAFPGFANCSGASTGRFLADNDL